jgi:hypothetical protein
MINIHYAVAIENNDYSGLEDYEIDYIKELLDLYPRLTFNFNDSPSFTRCYVSRLYGDCIEMTLNK